MTKTVKFYYDFLSPYSYMASTQLPALAERTGATFEHKPVLILKVMDEVGNSPTTMHCKVKGKYAFADLARWAQAYDVPVAPNPSFNKIDLKALALGALSAQELGVVDGYHRAVFAGVWAKQCAFANDQELIDLLADEGVSNGAEIIAGRDAMSEKLKANIAEAVSDGVFGAPSFVVDGQLFFGNDRLQFLECAIEEWELDCS